MREELMDAMLTNLLLQHQLPKSLGSRLLQHFEAEFRSASEGLAHAKRDLQTKKGDLSRKLAVLTELYLDQRVDYQTYVQKQNALQSDLTGLRAKLKILDTGHIPWLEPVRKWISTAQRIHEFATEGSMEGKRTLAREVFGSNLTLVGQKLFGRATKPWSALANSGGHPDLEHVVSAVRMAFGIPEPVGGGLGPNATTPGETSGS
ncbi:MAG: hypothetical protein U1G08_08675 [Verrucomicrobiota bacterium]